MKLIQNTATWLIRIYQMVVSPLLGTRCRFYPSCSEYAHECFQKHEPIVALRRSTLRLMKCHPWHAGGVDLP